jgi:thymidylate synthase (FAD)
MNDNKVELLGYYGSDLLHGLSAWTSTSRDLPEDKLARLPKLLNMLGSEGHHTPFEKSMFHFLVTTDIATHIHILKHRVGVSVNAESARYKELKDDKFYVPSDWDSEEQGKYITFMEDALRHYHDTLNRLVAKGVPRKRAKESARFYLPYGNQITSDISFNFRSFMHFQSLRNSEHAQLEVRELAQKMLDLVRATGQFDESLKAFGY